MWFSWLIRPEAYHAPWEWEHTRPGVLLLCQLWQMVPQEQTFVKLWAGLHLIHSPLNSLKSTTCKYPLSELLYWVSASYVVTPYGGPKCVSFHCSVSIIDSMFPLGKALLWHRVLWLVVLPLCGAHQSNTFSLPTCHILLLGQEPLAFLGRFLTLKVPLQHHFSTYRVFHCFQLFALI